MIQEVVELEDLVGSSRDIGPLGKGGHVGSLGCDAHATGIQKIEKKFIIVGEREIFNKTQ
jgi:hypothetical protein